MLNKVQTMGRLTKDPVLSYTKERGIPVLSIAIACDRRIIKDKPKETDFFYVVAWQTTAEFVAKHFTKGQMICIDGRLQQRSFKDEKTGEPRWVVEIVAESVHFAGFKREDNQGYNTSYPANFDPLADAA